MGESKGKETWWGPGGPWVGTGQNYSDGFADKLSMREREQHQGVSQSGPELLNGWYRCFSRHPGAKKMQIV